jgi:hypothetical protein
MKAIIKDKYNVKVDDYRRKVIVSKNVCFGGLKSEYPPATLPLSDADKVIVRQGTEWKEADKSEFGGANPVQSDMAQSDESQLDFVKSKNRVITVTADDGSTTNGTVTRIITKDYDDAVIYCVSSNDGNSLVLDFDATTYNNTFGVNVINNTGIDVTVQISNGYIIDMNNDGQQSTSIALEVFGKITLIKNGDNLIAM